MPPETKDKHIILTYFQHMAEKLAARLRLYGFQTKSFFIGLKTTQGWLTAKASTAYATDDGKLIFGLCQYFIAHDWRGEGVWQVRVVALDLQSEKQGDLFEQTISSSPQRDQLNHVVDDINQKFGEFMVGPSRLIGRSEMPNVIAPSWQPTGHRKTV